MVDMLLLYRLNDEIKSFKNFKKLCLVNARETCLVLSIQKYLNEKPYC